MAINHVFFETILNRKRVIPARLLLLVSYTQLVTVTAFLCWWPNHRHNNVLTGKSCFSKVVDGQRTGRRTGYVVPG